MNTSRSTFIRLICCCAAFQGQIFSQSGISASNIERVGQSGWQFLKILPDPKYAAMGGTVAAPGVGDAFSVFGNPAGLVQIGGPQVAFSRANWIADIGVNSISVAMSAGSIGTFAISVASVDYGDFAETVNQVTTTGDRTIAFVTGQTFTAQDIAVGLTYAREVTNRLSIGGSVRYLREGIAELSMSNWSIDFGTVYHTGYKSLRLGMTARNFGPDAKLVGWSEEFQAEPVEIRMPLDFRLGVAMDFLDEAPQDQILTVMLEGSHPNDGPEKLQMGAEYGWRDMLWVRAGYRMNYDVQGLTLGGGVRISIAGTSTRIDYAYLSFSELHAVHLFSLGLEWW